MGAGSTFSDPRFALRTAVALALANARYWTGVAPTVRGELRRWEERAQEIDDAELGALAEAKLHDESFHAQAAAMLATGAPRKQRKTVVEAIVALELLFDYLDGLTERPSADPLGHGERLFKALTDAVVVPPAGTGTHLMLPPQNYDGDGYLEVLSRAVSSALARLPAASAITEIAQRIAARSGQAQTRMHAASQLGTEQLEQWARTEAAGSDFAWPELLAGAASSVLTLHALIASAADPHTTAEDADEIAAAYMPACVVLTLLDGLVDRDEDARSNPGEHPSYISFYASPEELSRTLTGALRRASAEMRALRHGPRHAMTLVGVVAYYTSGPGSQSKLARPICARLQKQLWPLMIPALALMRAWRLAKRGRTGNRRAPGSGGLASSIGTTSQTGRVQ